MKNSKKYSKKVEKEYKDLKNAYKKVKPEFHEDVVEAIVEGLVTEKITLKQTEKVLKKFDDYFVDYNDLRVSRPDEITEQFPREDEEIKKQALNITGTLRAVFDKFNTMNINEVKKEGIRKGREILEEIPYMTPFSVDYTILTSFQGHAIPLTEKMIDYLKKNELIHPDSNYDTIQGFLCRLISSSDGYEFYKILRLASEDRKPAGKRKTKKKKSKSGGSKKKGKKSGKKKSSNSKKGSSKKKSKKSKSSKKK